MEVHVLPNPNKGVFTIKGSTGATRDEEVTLEVTDMLGQVVYKNKVMAVGGSVNEQILLNGALTNGMYILNISTASETKVYHFVVVQ